MIAFTLRGFSFYRYGIFYALTGLIGYGIFWYIGYSNLFHRSQRLHDFFTHEYDLFLGYVGLGILVGGRLGHVFIYNRSHYIHHVGEIFNLHEGGMSFIGGIIGVCIATLIWKKTRHYSWKEYMTVMDILIGVIMVGITLGRLGNYLNQELYGVPAHPFFLQSPRNRLTHIYTIRDSLPRYNTNLLAALGEGIIPLIASIIYFFRKKTQKVWYPGNIIRSFLIRYSAIRYLLEYLRADSQLEYVGLLTISQRYFLMIGLISVYIHWRIQKLSEMITL